MDGEREKKKGKQFYTEEAGRKGDPLPSWLFGTASMAGWIWLKICGCV